MRIQRLINELCIFKHRASATENERRAAQHIYQIMRSLGLVAVIEEFKSQQRMNWELATILSFFLLSAVFYFFAPMVSVILGIVGFLLFWGYFTTSFKPLSLFFRFSKSQNVVGKFPNPDAPFKIVFTAHYDSARSSPLWNPKRVNLFRFNFLAGVGLMLALVFMVALKPFSIEHPILNIAVVALGAFVVGQMVLQLYSGFSGKPVEGASDNASGVAVMLEMAARLKQKTMPLFEFWFVATGSEEVGAIGMKEFLRAHADDFDKETSYFINFDNIGSGTLHYFVGEGMLKLYRFSNDLILAAKKTTQLKKFQPVTSSTY
ncbi:MAG: M28 family peptidase, partial [bacterium]|nr:M28 family peptidase [bacterium]